MGKIEIKEPKNGIFLINGNSVDINQYLLNKLGNNFADLILTDPPYGCSLNENINEFNKDIPCFTSKQLWDIILSSAKEDAAILMFNEGSGYLRMCYDGFKYFRYNYAVDFLKKRGHLNSNRMPMLRHGLVAVFYKKRPIYHPPYNFNGEGDGKNSDMLFVKKIKHQIYPHERDVELLKYFVETYTNQGDIVYDFAMGSGSCAEACYLTKRKFIGVELIKETFDKAFNRISEL